MSSTPDLGGIGIGQWVKSTYSGGEGGDCMEWSPTHAHAHGVVPIRDSKNPHGPALALPPSAWTAFVSAVQRAGITA